MRSLLGVEINYSILMHMGTLAFHTFTAPDIAYDGYSYLDIIQVSHGAERLSI